MFVNYFFGGTIKIITLKNTLPTEAHRRSGAFCSEVMMDCVARATELALQELQSITLIL